MNTYPNTSAPWSIGSNGASVKVTDADGKAVCMLTPRKGAWNGDLIAAAPDLLEAADDALADLEGYEFAAETIRKLRAAIAKATGEEI